MRTTPRPWCGLLCALSFLWTAAVCGQGAAPADGGAPQPAAWPEFSGKVVGVDDGQSVTVQKEGRSSRIRLCGLEAPRPGQEYAGQSKAFLAGLAFGREVTVKPRERGADGRLAAVVQLKDGRNVNQEVVRAGMAWAARAPAADPALVEIEADARGDRRGLWREENPVAPWDFRSTVTTGASSTASADTIKVTPPPPDPNAPKTDAAPNQPFNVDVLVVPPVRPR